MVVNSSNTLYDKMVEDWNTVDLKKLVEDCGSKVCSQEEIKSSECQKIA